MAAASVFQRFVCPRLHPGKRRHYRAAAFLGSNAHVNNNVQNLDGRPDVYPQRQRHHPLTNGGTIEGAWIFHRHGDRAPNRYLGDRSHLRHESDHWYGRIPPPPGAGDSAHYDNLSRCFPPEIHGSQNGGRYLDVDREPFGFLTYRGMDQMRCTGGRFRRRYERFGHRAHGSSCRPYSFLDHWNVQAYSTNYLRTVSSVQCFLDGLIGKSPGDGGGNNQNRIYAGGGLKRYYKDMGRYEQLAMDMRMRTTAEDMKGDSIKIQVRDREIDTLNAFDKHPRMMDGLVKDVIATEQFQRIDGAARPLAETLSSYLPGLLGAPQAFGGTPSGVNWVHANDHFVCRAAHAVPLTAFSDREGRREEEDALAALANPVRSHLAWRFREWYRCPRLLAAVACPPFREVLGHMMDAVVAADDCDGRRPFVLYSCHDVTLLALLYAIGADFLVSEEDDGGLGMREVAYSGMDSSGYVRDRNAGSSRQKSWRWWPAYSSTIAFELVRLEEEERHAVRVILNGHVVKTIPRMSVEDEGLLKEQLLSSRQVFGEVRDDGEGHNLMKLSDFERVIRVLEEAGGGIMEGGRFPPAEERKSDEMSKIGVDSG